MPVVTAPLNVLCCLYHSLGGDQWSIQKACGSGTERYFYLVSFVELSGTFLRWIRRNFKLFKGTVQVILHFYPTHPLQTQIHSLPCSASGEHMRWIMELSSCLATQFQPGEDNGRRQTRGESDQEIGQEISSPSDLSASILYLGGWGVGRGGCSAVLCPQFL